MKRVTVTMKTKVNLFCSFQRLKTITELVDVFELEKNGRYNEFIDSYLVIWSEIKIFGPNDYRWTMKSNR